MRIFASLAVSMAGALILASCGGPAPSAPAPATGSSASPSAAARGTPAATGTAAATAPRVRFERVFPNLPAFERATAMVEVEDGWFAVTLQDGRVLGFPDDPAVSSTVTHLDIRARTSRAGNEEGLLHLAIDPNFATNRFVYLYYSTTDGARATLLSRFTATGSKASMRLDPASELVILRVPQPYSNHKGGTIAFGPDGMLYLGLGDGGSAGDPNDYGQDLTKNLLGSIIRIDVRNATAAQPYAIPPDNPFASGAGGRRPETWAYGLRNPWRMSFDRAAPHGLFAGDVGQNAYEEVDLITKGSNYGWRIMEGAHCFSPREGCSQAGLTLPLAEYATAQANCSVTGGYVYRGSAIPPLQGVYLFSDYCSGTLRALRDPYGSPQGLVLIASGVGVVSFVEDLEGELSVVGSDGRIYRLVAA
jgi:glucose/arabinose dehydrogenase